MFDCAKDLLAFHDEKITLPDAERTAMRTRRDANRDRVRKGLTANDKPLPWRFKSQGSYEMRTMIQHPAKDYDIDDGVYFRKSDLVGPQGGEMSALQARQMVRDAVDDGSFKTPPSCHKNCVRVHYDAGYHVDLPVYRTVTETDIWGTETTYQELASSTWKRSDACDVTAWFDDANTTQSPDTTNGRQLRRITREIKKFARSRDSWCAQILSGFAITALVVECYKADLAREDRALHNTMKAIRDRLTYNLVIDHPCTAGVTITSGTDDAKAKFFRTKLSDALTWLEPVFAQDCTRAKALAAWDKLYCTDYFSLRASPVSEAARAIGAPAILSSGFLTQSATAAGIGAAVRKDGGGRYA